MSAEVWPQQPSESLDVLLDRLEDQTAAEPEPPEHRAARERTDEERAALEHLVGGG